MSIFQSSQNKTGIVERKPEVKLICFSCRENFSVTTYNEFRCPNCEQYYTYQQYSLQFFSLLTSTIFEGKKTEPESDTVNTESSKNDSKKVVKKTIITETLSDSEGKKSNR